ncbi:hypothetical protein MJC1_04152 [Methylocystis sp. MJC1]|nr:hypothetical protein MJC1_04152 [Methylocystis sp. MJC1]
MYRRLAKRLSSVVAARAWSDCGQMVEFDSNRACLTAGDH